MGPAAAGCGATETGAKAGLASSCNVNSDCASPLVCTLGRCHAACKANVDCARDEICIESGGAGVCQFSEEGRCTYKSDCGEGLFCAGDGHCRNQCQASADCLPGQLCTPSGACADPTELGATGDLLGIPSGGTDAGTHTGTGGSDGKGGGSGQGGLSGGAGFPTAADAGVRFGTGGLSGQGGFNTGMGGAPNAGCGLTSQPCCGDMCTDGVSVCVFGQCRPCGAVNSPCCTNDVCNANATCSQNQCVACGSLSEPCCGTACTGGLVCTAGTCDVPCTAPFVAKGGACVLPAPRLVAPISGSFLNTRTPKITFALPGGITTAHVQLCKDRGCTNVIDEGDAPSTGYVPGSALPMGIVFFRASSENGADAGAPEYSATWEMAIGGAHDAPKMAPWGAMPDFDGDGRTDVAATVQVSQGQVIRVYPGVVGGISGTPVTLTVNGGFPGQALPVGDFDGDGFTDLALWGGPGLEIHRGSAAGIALTASQTVSGVSSGDRQPSAGDVDGDGYADLVLSGSQPDANNNMLLVVTVYRGSATGLSSTPVVTTTSILHNSGSSTTCDVDGDGVTDVIVTNNGNPSQQTLSVFKGGSSLSHVWTDATVATAGNPFASPSCIGDVDGDGYDDIAVQTMNTVQVYRGSASALVAGASTAASPPQGAAPDTVFSLGAGDVDGNGYADYVFASGAATLSLVTGGPSGTVASVTLPPPGGFSVQSSVVQAVGGVGDVDGDGHPDFAAGVEWTSTSSLKNHQFYVLSGAAGAPGTALTVLPITVITFR